MTDLSSFDLFAPASTRPGSLGCRTEIAAALSESMRRAAERGITREEIASRMSIFLGERISVATLNGYSAQSHTTKAVERGEPARDITLVRAMAFDAAVEEDVLLGLFTSKRGSRRVVSNEDAALLEWAKLHRQEKELAERKKALEAVMKIKGGKQ
ncbi:MAG: hypothetical protein AB1513_12050 [Pseudomonadota bacterium]